MTDRQTTTIGSLFSGIGGLELGLEWAGLGPVVWQVEKDPFCQKVLAKHWPDADRSITDVRIAGRDNLTRVDLICGGFPCQDVSSAGKGAGLAGERSGLWYQFARIVRELEPDWVVVENVASGANRWVDVVVQGLAGCGYHCIPIPLSAFDVGAPHLRRRVFIVAHPNRQSERRLPINAEVEGASEPVANATSECERESTDETDAIPAERCTRKQFRGPGWWQTEPAVGRVADGVPDRMARLRALGNAVVPQCAEVIGWIVRELITSNQTPRGDL